MRALFRQSSVLSCTGLLLAPVIMGTFVPMAAAQARDSHRPWVLISEIRILPETIGSSDSYRLAGPSGQLVALQSDNRPVFGWKAIPPEEHPPSRNIRIHRAFEDPNFGDALGTKFVQLKEPVALWFEDRGYLVYAGSDTGPRDLTRAANSLAWQRKSNFNHVTNTPDVYQWRFENPRDHRKDVDLRTKMEVALFNSVSRCYLVIRARRLAWQRQ
ncbi:MAG: hypothetical protein KIT09_07470 [Bryobacteraceae bacterium]|nr:hypothetical protein [Bryobacteraceae bacterium]